MPVYYNNVGENWFGKKIKSDSNIVIESMIDFEEELLNGIFEEFTQYVKKYWEFQFFDLNYFHNFIINVYDRVFNKQWLEANYKYIENKAKKKFNFYTYVTDDGIKETFLVIGNIKDVSEILTDIDFDTIKRNGKKIDYSSGRIY